MIHQFHHQRSTFSYRLLSAIIAFTFMFSVIAPPTPVYAQLFPQGLANLPIPGTMVSMTPGYTPAMVTGMTVYPDNPLEFDFIVNSGDDQLEGETFKKESTRLIKYFLAALTVPEEDIWVNLSPYEKDRIVPQGFGDTEMGRDLLAQDYILKQLTASLMYPEDELGEKFWERVRAKAYEKFGTTEIPMNTFNKVWIVPDEAIVYEHGRSAFVLKSYLKVMLEEDYVALQENMGVKKYGLDGLVENEAEVVSGISSEVIREVLIPEIEKEVNQGETFANLRQIYNSAILATWYSKNLQEGLLGKIYVGQNKTAGIDTKDKQANQKIYDQYVEAFKKGVYNYIREDYDPTIQDYIPRKYFSGGADVTRIEIEKLLQTLRSTDIKDLDNEDLAVLEHFSENGPGTFAFNVNLLEVNKANAEETEQIANEAAKRSASPIETPSWFKSEANILSRNERYKVLVEVGRIDSPSAHIWLQDTQSTTEGFAVDRGTESGADAQSIALEIQSILDVNQDNREFKELHSDFAQLVYLRDLIIERFDGKTAASPVTPDSVVKVMSQTLKVPVKELKASLKVDFNVLLGNNTWRLGTLAEDLEEQLDIEVSSEIENAFTSPEAVIEAVMSSASPVVSGQRTYAFGVDLEGNNYTEGDKSMKALLGGKGANLAEMTRNGIPVPNGFTIVTTESTEFENNGNQLSEELKEEIRMRIKQMELATGLKFGDKDNPLLVSVRSGAAISMPGMMETVLNVGLNDESVIGFGKKTNPRTAWDSDRRLIMMAGETIFGIEKEKFDTIFDAKKKMQGVTSDTGLTADDLEDVTYNFQTLFLTETGMEFPQDPYDQLFASVGAVFKSDGDAKANKYRKINKLLEFGKIRR